MVGRGFNVMVELVYFVIRRDKVRLRFSVLVMFRFVICGSGCLLFINFGRFRIDMV